MNLRKTAQPKTMADTVSFGVGSMAAPLRRVAVRPPGQAMITADPVQWHYGPAFDPAKIADQHSEFVSLLRSHGAELLVMEGDDQGNVDAVFAYDASLMTPSGAILMSPGKALRRGEQRLHAQFYEAQQIPILGDLSATEGATAEAGDTFWLDQSNLAVGRGYRTNEAGIAAMRDLLEPGIMVHAFDLPVHQGPDACLHLMSLVSPVDQNMALVAMPLLPVALAQLMQAMEYELIEVPLDEFEASGTLCANVLATSPSRVIMLDGFPQTRRTLERHGVQVDVFDGSSLCLGCEGGPTCLTRPIWRR